LCVEGERTILNCAFTFLWFQTVHSHFCSGTIHDKTNGEACQNCIQSTRIPSGYTKLQDFLQHSELRNRIYSVYQTLQMTDSQEKEKQGHLIFYNSGPIIWKSNRQRTIVLSITETELYREFINSIHHNFVLTFFKTIVLRLRHAQTTCHMFP